MKTLDQILSTTEYSDLFQEGTRKELRNLLRHAHPDLHPDHTQKAEKAFIHINDIWNKKAQPNRTATSSTAKPSSDISTKKNTYSNLKSLRKNNGVETFTSRDNNGNSVSLLVSTHPKIGEALINGVKNLKTIKNNIPTDYKEFFPDTTDAFRINQNNAKLFGVAQTLPKPNYSLREVKEDYPEGIDGRDIAWMYRRMLVSVGNMHDTNIGHGAPTLDAFLTNPKTHELQLTNWQFSNPLGEDILMVTPDIKHHYQSNRTLSRTKDLQILSEAAFSLIRADTPRPLKAFLNGMQKYPTTSAQEALHEFDELLHETYGPRSFHKFDMKRD